MDRLRWNYSKLLEVSHSGFYTGTGKVICNDPGDSNQDNLFNASKDSITLSIFCRQNDALDGKKSQQFFSLD